MTRMKPALLLLIVALAAAAPAWAGSDDILGAWLNQKHDAKIDIFKCGNDYRGKIVWLKEPVYPAGSTLGTPDTPKLDHYNPDVARKMTPLMDMQIMQVCSIRATTCGRRARSTIPTAVRPIVPKPLWCRPQS